MAFNLFLDRSINALISKPILEPKPKSKSLKSYYKLRIERLLYGKSYYNKHKETILTNKRNRYTNLKVQRTQNNISLIHDIKNGAYPYLKHELNECLSFHDSSAQEYRKIMNECLYHQHGAPKIRKYNIPKHYLSFHLVPQLFAYMPVPNRTWVTINPLNCQKDYCISAKVLAAQISHFLRLKLGDSFVWQELNRWGNAVKHFLNFDESGLDIAFSRDLENLVNFSIESGLKGLDLLSEFALKFSVGNYISVYRGNKILITSNPESMMKAYLRDCAKFD